MTAIDELFGILIEHEHKFARSFSLIPSENTLSPLARLAFLSDGYSRYFFDEKETFGRWSFQGGSIVGRVQREILVPLLRDLGRARHVDLHAVSGLTGMMLALAAFGRPGTAVFSVPVANGGHPDTVYVARKLGMYPVEIPFCRWDEIDLEALAAAVHTGKPSLVYIDHATALFPLDLACVIMTIRAAAPDRVHVHVDTSHVNGLIWGGQLPNPLDCGADTYGGSTHKTFPGPHKAVLLTNDGAAFEELTATAVNLISHHHTASMVALAIAALEFAECGGRDYARQTVVNARAFATDLAELGLDVQGADRGFTCTHQVWIAPPEGQTAYEAASTLFEAGVVVNPYNPLPSLGGPGLRMGLNEPTRLGIGREGLRGLAECVADALLRRRPREGVAMRIGEIRRTCRPTYCYGPEELHRQWARLASEIGDERASVSMPGEVAP